MTAARPGDLLARIALPCKSPTAAGLVSTAGWRSAASLGGTADERLRIRGQRRADPHLGLLPADLPALPHRRMTRALLPSIGGQRLQGVGGQGVLFRVRSGRDRGRTIAPSSRAGTGCSRSPSRRRAPPWSCAAASGRSSPGCASAPRGCSCRRGRRRTRRRRARTGGKRWAAHGGSLSIVEGPPRAPGRGRYRARPAQRASAPRPWTGSGHHTAAGACRAAQDGCREAAGAWDETSAGGRAVGGCG